MNVNDSFIFIKLMINLLLNKEIVKYPTVEDLSYCKKIAIVDHKTVHSRLYKNVIKIKAYGWDLPGQILKELGENFEMFGLTKRK